MLFLGSFDSSVAGRLLKLKDFKNTVLLVTLVHVHIICTFLAQLNMLDTSKRFVCVQKADWSGCSCILSQIEDVGYYNFRFKVCNLFAAR